MDMDWSILIWVGGVVVAALAVYFFAGRIISRRRKVTPLDDGDK